MSEIGEEQAVVNENADANGDVEQADTSAKENDDIASHKIVLDVNGDPSADEDDDKKEQKDDGEEGDDTSGLEEGEFEVERILDVKLKDGTIKFEVRWKGYGSEEDSWEPEENLETARLVLDDYIATNKEKVEKIKRMLNERKKRGKKSRGRPPSYAPSKERRRGTRKSRRRSGSAVELSDSEDDDEVKEQKEETRKGAQQRKKCRDPDEEVSSNDAESSGDEDFVVSSRSAKRAKKGDEHRVNASATRVTRVREEPLLKEPRPRNAKNAWLYDDADDGDSDDDSEHNDSDKKQKKEEGRSETDASDRANKRGKRHSTVDEEAQAGSKRSRREPSAELASKREEKKRKCADGRKRKRETSPAVTGDEQQEDGAVSTVEDDAAGDERSVDNNIASKKSIGRAATNTESVEVIGIVKMKESGVQVMCRRKDSKTHLLTVEEVVALDAMSLVEYLLARTVFTSGGQ